jgi:NAD-dependent deacetylase
MKKKKIVALTGAGISAESGVKTFRDAGGLWEGHRIEEVATVGCFEANPELVLNFYNSRRQQLSIVEPNEAHKLLADLQKDYEVVIITQNVDDLHERAGSLNIIHLHGELKKMRGVDDPYTIYDCNEDIKVGDKSASGAFLRPHIVWFGEDVPMIVPAVEQVKTADIVLVIGTSLQVYPAAGLMEYAREEVPIYYIDLHPALLSHGNLTVIAEKASTGVAKAIELIIKKKNKL